MERRTMVRRRCAALLCAAAFAAGTGFLWAQQQVCPATPGDQQNGQLCEVTLEATDRSFNPTVITASPQQHLCIRLVNRGRERHGLVLLLGSNPVSIGAPLGPGESRMISLDVPRLPGAYRFYCPVKKGMEGQLIVRGESGS